MKELYIKSIIALKEYDRKPSVKEWNKIARKYNFLTTKSMTFISNTSWDRLCKMVRKK